MNNKPLPIAIKLTGVSKKYAEKKVLNSIELEIQSGQIVGYIGQNGAGKTTTIKILVGMIKDFNGSVEVCGFDNRKDPLEVKKRIGYVPELATIYETLTPFEYLEFVGNIYQIKNSEVRSRAEKMLRILDLEREMHQPMMTFSKGMKQKVLFIAAIIHNPEVIILDEPLSGLDAHSIVLVKEILIKLAKSGKTIFYSSHLMDVVEKVCDRIIILSNGTIVADGNIKQLQQLENKISLENIFTQITSPLKPSHNAEEFIKSLDFEVEN